MILKDSVSHSLPPSVPDQTLWAPMPVQLRDWFAGQALAALLGNLARVLPDKGEPYQAACAAYASCAYAMADAMIAARAEERT